jgi:hypothetical protein
MSLNFFSNGHNLGRRPEMNLSIIGCPEKERFRPYVKRAALFYAENLMSDKMLENIFLRIKFDNSLEVYGRAAVLDYNESGKPRMFEIELHPGIGAHDILETLAHEMIHIKQFAYGDTDSNLTRWRGDRIPEDTDYYDEPWEIEAYGKSPGIFTKFVIKEKLWEVFKDIGNPDAPIESSQIKWVQYGETNPVVL